MSFTVAVFQIMILSIVISCKLVGVHDVSERYASYINSVEVKTVIFLPTILISSDQAPVPCCHPRVWVNHIPCIISTLKMEAVYSYETSASAYMTTQCHNSENYNLNCLTCWFRGNILALYSGGVRFDSRPGNLLSRLIVFVMSLSQSGDTSQLDSMHYWTVWMWELYWYTCQEAQQLCRWLRSGTSPKWGETHRGRGTRDASTVPGVSSTKPHSSSLSDWNELVHIH
jgi:hypothetical protein